MRSLPALSLLTALVAGAAAAQDCTIENAIQTDAGPSTGVTGTCSNNGEPIECRYAVDGSVSCTGPDGTFSGNNPDTLIASACGCHP